MKPSVQEGHLPAQARAAGTQLSSCQGAAKLCEKTTHTGILCLQSSW